MLLHDLIFKSDTVKAPGIARRWAAADGSHALGSRVGCGGVPPPGCEFRPWKHCQLRKSKGGEESPCPPFLANTSKLNLDNHREIEKDFLCDYHKMSTLWNFRLRNRKEVPWECQ